MCFFLRLIIKKITHIMSIVFFVVEKFAYLSDDVGDIPKKHRRKNCDNKNRKLLNGILLLFLVVMYNQVPYL